MAKQQTTTKNRRNTKQTPRVKIDLYTNRNEYRKYRNWGSLKPTLRIISNGSTWKKAIYTGLIYYFNAREWLRRKAEGKVSLGFYDRQIKQGAVNLPDSWYTSKPGDELKSVISVIEHEVIHNIIDLTCPVRFGKISKVRYDSDIRSKQMSAVKKKRKGEEQIVKTLQSNY